MASLLYRVPILSRFVRKGGKHGRVFQTKVPSVEVRGSHPCKRRKDGAPSTEMVHAVFKDEPPAVRLTLSLLQTPMQERQPLAF
jgi:hypothetical protein